MLVPALLSLTLSTGLLAPVADTPPHFDVEASCRGVSRADSGVGRPPSACLDDERKAEGELGRKWGSYKAADRTRCAEEAQLAGNPSYVEILTCLEMTKP